MSGKPKPTKKKSAKPASRPSAAPASRPSAAAKRSPSPAPANSKPKRPAPAPAAEGFFVAVSDAVVLVADARPKDLRASGPHADFRTVKCAAVDGLIEAIEAAELRLDALKRAQTLDELRAVL
jgi:hypothetical protein